MYLLKFKIYEINNKNEKYYYYINAINEEILKLLFDNIQNKNYKTFIFFDGVPSYNKILH